VIAPRGAGRSDVPEPPYAIEQFADDVVAVLDANSLLVLGPAAWGPFGPLLAIGTALTLIERAMVAVRELA